VGDSVTLQVKLGGSAASAMVFCDTDAVESSDQPLSQTGQLTAHYEKAGQARWGVALMDSSGALLSVCHYEEEVQP
jgi:hypothetical protein